MEQLSLKEFFIRHLWQFGISPLPKATSNHSFNFPYFMPGVKRGMNVTPVSMKSKFPNQRMIQI